MNNKKLTAAIVTVAAAIVCLAAILIVKHSASPAVQPVEGSVSDVQSSTHSYVYPSETTYTEPASEAETKTESATDSVTEKTTLEKITDKVTAAVQTTAELTTLVKGKFSEVFTLPQAPKYIPPDVNIDFNKVNLASYKYDPNGNYYYTDDKDCWQSNFGYNEGYDSLAVVGVMYYDTVRTKFVYDNKEWLIQIWKGQYGYCFVGGEVGVYTRPIGKSGSAYSCAAKEDWLKMEMTLLWKFNGGDYEPVFTRPYTDYWWCTGFVVGYEADESRLNREQFRMITHITFKDTAMAEAFCKAFEANGFKRVSKLNNTEKDTFVQLGPDVAFVWQSINQHII